MMLILKVLTLLVVAVGVKGHGRLWDPPARSTMWRFREFPNEEKNYNDNQLYCGGFQRQKSLGGKCGVCGDPFDGPRDHEAPDGKYYTDTIARTYKQGEVITVEVQITAYHKGWFEFRLCDTQGSGDVTHECLNRNLLVQANNQGARIRNPGTGFHSFDLRLPKWISCDYCVLQWKYHAGNSWGVDRGGRGCIGCGEQEEFYGCANVKIAALDAGDVPDDRTIVQSDDTPDETSTSSTRKTTRTTRTTATTRTSPTTATTRTSPTTATTRTSPTTATTTTTRRRRPQPPPGQSQCRATGVWRSVDGMNTWCWINCGAGFCPSSHCVCS